MNRLGCPTHRRSVILVLIQHRIQFDFRLTAAWRSGVIAIFFTSHEYFVGRELQYFLFFPGHDAAFRAVISLIKMFLKINNSRFLPSSPGAGLTGIPPAHFRDVIETL